MAITGVQVFSLPVTDQDRARDFYVDVLGFELVNDLPMGPGMRWVQVRPPGGSTSITLVTWFDQMPAGSLQGLMFAVDNVDELAGALFAKGYLESSDVAQEPWGRYVVLKDPDGNSIILQEPPH